MNNRPFLGVHCRRRVLFAFIVAGCSAPTDSVSPTPKGAASGAEEDVTPNNVPSPSPGEFSVSAQAGGYEVRLRDANGVASTVQCGGTCEEICGCVGAACSTALAQQACAAEQATCLENCNRSSCSAGDARCFYGPFPADTPPSDPEGPRSPPGGAGPDPAPVDR